MRSVLAGALQATCSSPRDSLEAVLEEGLRPHGAAEEQPRRLPGSNAQQLSTLVFLMAPGSLAPCDGKQSVSDKGDSVLLNTLIQGRNRAQATSRV